MADCHFSRVEAMKKTPEELREWARDRAYARRMGDRTRNYAGFETLEPYDPNPGPKCLLFLNLLDDEESPSQD